MTVRALVADDEPLLRQELIEALGIAWPELSVIHEAQDGQEALQQTLILRPDLVFLDINMPRLGGMSAAQRLRERGYAGEIVFVTAYEEYARQAFDVNAVDYLVKPLDLERVGETIARLRLKCKPGVPAQAAAPRDTGLQEAPSAPWIRVTSGTHATLVWIEELACLRASAGYTSLVTRDKTHLVEQSLKVLQQRLPPEHFVQVHRSAVVNLHFVQRIVRECAGRYVVELKHELGLVEVSRAGAELLRRL